MSVLQSRVLILNLSYEPIGTMSVAQAMCKMTRTDSSLQVIEWDDNNRTLNTTRGEYPVPSVMKLNYYVDIIKRRSKSGATREKIYQRDKFKCEYCGAKMGKFHKGLNKVMAKSDLTLDHIMPRSRGGLSRPDNLVTCCKPCNQRKADRTPEEARMPLRTSTTLLKVHLDTIAICAYAEYNENWKKYLFMGDGKGEVKLTHTGSESFG